MCFKNTQTQFGIITRLLHAAIGIGFLLQFFLMYMRNYYLIEDEDKLRYILTHKSVGFCMLVIGAIFLLWSQINIRPALPSHMARWEVSLAKGTHHFLMFCIALMPLSGATMTLLSGRNLSVFGWFQINGIQNIPPIFGKTAHSFHIWLSFALLAAILIHLAGAAKHFFVYKDNIVRRMFF